MASESAGGMAMGAAKCTVRLARLALLLACFVAGSYVTYAMISKDSAVYNGVDDVGALSYQYTPPGLETCADVDVTEGQAYPRIGNMGAWRIDDAKKAYYGTPLGGVAKTDYDVVRLKFFSDPTTPIEGISEVYYFSRPIYSRLYPSWLRAFSLGAFQLKLGVMSVYVVSDECSDSATVTSASVASASYIFQRARGTDGLAAVSLKEIGDSSTAAWPALAESAAISGDWVRFSCGGSAPGAVPPSGFKAHPLGSHTCTPFTAEQIYFDNDHVTFLTIDALIVLIASLYVLYELRDDICATFVKVVHSIGPEAFFERAKLTEAPAGESLMQVILDASGPFFFLDFLVSNPTKCATTFSHGLLSAFLHYVFIVLPSVPLILGLTLLGCQREDEFDASGETSCTPRPFTQAVLGLIAVQQLSALLFAATWYLEVPFKVQKAFRTVAKKLYTLVSIITIFYVVQSVVMLFVAVTIQPGYSITTLVLIGTPVLYIVYTARALSSAKPAPPAIDILAACATGAIALYALVFWLMLAVAMFLPPTGNGLGPLGASLGTISSAVALGQSQISKMHKMAAEQSDTYANLKLTA